MSNFMGGMTNMGLPNMGISNMGISNMGGLTTMESISNGIPIGATSSGITGIQLNLALMCILSNSSLKVECHLQYPQITYLPRIPQLEQECLLEDFLHSLQ